MMLNILKRKANNKNNNNINNLSKPLDKNKKGNDIGLTRHYPPANKEWFNSIYAFNKNSIKLLPIFDLLINKLIKGYFNLYNQEFEKKIRFKRLRVKNRRFSAKRIFVGKPELKYSNNKIVITLYIYNAEKKYLVNKLQKETRLIWLNKHLSKKIKLIRLKALALIKEVKREKNLLIQKFKWNKDNFVSYEEKEYNNIIKLLLKKEILEIYLKQFLLFNKSKFENTYLSRLNHLINKIYNKKIEFNLVNLKYIHLDSTIFSEFVTMKLTKKTRKNKKLSLLRVLKASLRKIKLPFYNRDIISNNLDNGLDKLLLLNKFNNLKVKSLFYQKQDNKDILNEKLQEVFSFSKDQSLNTLEDNVLSSIKHKWVSGVRLETKGRLSKRITASRSIFKFKYKGSLKNIDSSYKSISSVMLRGHKKSNLQYTKINSKNRNGSFGLKGWVSSR